MALQPRAALHQPTAMDEATFVRAMAVVSRPAQKECSLSQQVRGASVQQLEKLLCALHKASPELTKLWLNDNQLVELPPALGAFQALTTLCLHDNQLLKLPRALKNLQELTRLFVGNNHLVQLPIFMVGLPKLNTLWLRNNPALGGEAQEYRGGDVNRALMTRSILVAIAASAVRRDVLSRATTWAWWP